MKSLLLSLALLSAPGAMAVIEHEATVEQVDYMHDQDASDAQAEPACSVEDPVEDSFDALMDTDVPTDMIVQPKPVSALEACAKQVGVQLLMKYIAVKVWLEQRWASLMTRNV